MFPFKFLYKTSPLNFVVGRARASKASHFKLLYRNPMPSVHCHQLEDEPGTSMLVSAIKTRCADKILQFCARCQPHLDNPDDRQYYYYTVTVAMIPDSAHYNIIAVGRTRRVSCHVLYSTG